MERAGGDAADQPLLERQEDEGSVKTTTPPTS
jgi:hypothetical protein